MGKLILAGIFLGAAVTWSVMYFLVPKGFSQKELEAEVEQAKKRERDTTTEKKDLECKAKLQAQDVKLGREHEKGLVERDGKIIALERVKKELLAKAEETALDLAALTKKKGALEGLVRQLTFQVGKKSSAPTKLLGRRMDLMRARVKLWRTLGEVASVLTQAEIGWPDVERARKTSRDLTKLVEEHAALSHAVKVYIEENSKELSVELNKELGPRALGALRADVRDDDIKGISELAKKLDSAIAKLKTDSAVVEAQKDGWTDTEVVVERGDIIHVRSDGVWRMIAHWPTRGPDGWEGGGQYRITHEARTGSLIMRIGVSDTIFPAYLGKPIIADSAGRVVFRMNDKDVGENGGEVKVKVASGNPVSLRAAASTWNRITK